MQPTDNTLMSCDYSTANVTTETQLRELWNDGSVASVLSVSCCRGSGIWQVTSWGMKFMKCASCNYSTVNVTTAMQLRELWNDGSVASVLSVSCCRGSGIWQVTSWWMKFMKCAACNYSTVNVTTAMQLLELWNKGSVACVLLVSCCRGSGTWQVTSWWMKSMKSTSCNYSTANVITAIQLCEL